MNHHSRISPFVAVFGLLLASLPVGAQAPSGKATITMSGQTKSYSQFVAIKGESYGEPRIMVIATNQPLSAAALKKLKKKGAEENNDVEINDVHLKAVFTDSGELRYIFGRTDRASFGSLCMPEHGSATIDKGRIKGNLKYVEEGDFARTITWNFDVPLDAPVATTSAPTFDPPVKPTVTGTFTGNGKPAKLAYVSAIYHEPFNDKESVTLLFTEKDHTKDPQAKIKSAFGEYGSAFILSVNNSGGIFGCEIAHKSHDKAPFTAIGDANLVEFEMAKGNVKGHVSTGGEVDAFDQKWQVDLTFAAPLPAEYRTAKKPTEAKSEDDEEDDEEDEEEMEKEIVPTISIMEVPIPKNATDIEYRKTTEQVKFNSPQPVRTVVKELSDALKAKGWSDGPGGVIGKQNAIVNRVKGDAALKMIVKPNGTGSTTLIFGEHLKWDDAPNAKKRVAQKRDDDEDPEESIRGAVKDALKEANGVPKEAQDAIDKTLDEIFKE